LRPARADLISEPLLAVTGNVRPGCKASAGPGANALAYLLRDKEKSFVRLTF